MVERYERDLEMPLSKTGNLSSGWWWTISSSIRSITWRQFVCRIYRKI